MSQILELKNEITELEIHWSGLAGDLIQWAMNVHDKGDTDKKNGEGVNEFEAFETKSGLHKEKKEVKGGASTGFCRVPHAALLHAATAFSFQSL